MKQQSMFQEVKKTAVISPCGNYRYRLGRVWDNREPVAVWIGLNPSTANAEVDDPTIRRMVSFAMSWGLGGIDVVNLFALRSPDPQDLTCGWCDPVGGENDGQLMSSVVGGRVATVVCAWGANPFARGRAIEMMQHFEVAGVKTYCLGTNKDGSPKHPLYVRGDTPLIEYR